MKRVTISILIVILSVLFLPGFNSITKSQSINIEKKAVLYQLPYPGILPGHPLYFFKFLRDKILIFTTRDKSKKAILYLHLSDRHMAAAEALVNEGKELLAIQELNEAENIFLEIPTILKDLKSQGGDYPGDLILDLNQSNLKHREVIASVLEKMSQGEISAMENLINLNDNAKKSLGKL